MLSFQLQRHELLLLLQRKGRNQSRSEIATDFLQSDTQYLPVSAAAATKDGRSDEEWEFERKGGGTDK